MGIISRGFKRPDRPSGDVKLPPGQYRTTDFPVLSAGPTPRIAREDWRFEITTEAGRSRSWNWQEFRKLPTDDITVDLHCVTKWSQFGMAWCGVSLDTLLADVETAADFAFVRSYGGYTTNLPLDDLRDGKAWIAFSYDGDDLHPSHGGPARLLVPHLYLWKSAKWVRGIDLRDDDEPGFWEQLGYHNYGDPWREQRYWGD
ncbi:molybdopterin-dependent oxidoreductase [Antrihabitans spumae]|jgi:DMSO/TMAO reductase YedYZ molybdopterin-dependent catalytic subunit|uniref:Molybdopterin-dependent oxidoreductase n=1 Tax=Antrihabitans spumae TaxID=3373370 RepID=A0ABW7K1C3_9NOCA